MSFASATPLPATPNGVAGKGTPTGQSTQAKHRRSRHLNVAAAAVGILTAAVIVSAFAFFISGGRWFIVSTPSMGRTAPVGTFVLTAPIGQSQLLPGQIITFHPPTDPAEIYTHRIISNDNGAIRTRGDINGALDPWTLGRSDIIGRTIGVIPDLGWLIRGLPYLLIGVPVLWGVTRKFLSPPNRVAARVLGLSLLASVIAVVLKPFVGIVMLATFVEDGSAKATVVSTGMFPLRVQALGGTHVNLADGMVGTVSTPTAGHIGAYSVATSLHLPFLGWVLLGVFCAAPLIWCLIVGLPQREAGETE